MGNLDPTDYAKMVLVLQGYTSWGFNGLAEGELTSRTITHNLGFTPMVVASHFGGGANILGNQNDPRLQMIGLPFASHQFSGGTTKLRYSEWYVATNKTLTFYRYQGAILNGAGDDAELVKYYLFAQDGAFR